MGAPWLVGQIDAALAGRVIPAATLSTAYWPAINWTVWWRIAATMGC